MDDISRPPSDGPKPTYERRTKKRRSSRRKKQEEEALPPELRGDRGVAEKPDAEPAETEVDAVIEETEAGDERPDQPTEEASSEAQEDIAEAGDATEAEAADAPATEAPAAEAADVDDAEPPPLENPEELARVIFAALLVTREPISKLRLAQLSGASQGDVAKGLESLENTLRDAGLPVEVSRVNESVRLLTLPEVFPYLKRLGGVKKAERLSAAALETLAVVAYRQPVMRGEIEAIRGVKVGPTLRTLLDHKLVDVVGRADVPGRPLQYGTTQHFLDRFGLSSLKELPSVREFKSL